MRYVGGKGKMGKHIAPFLSAELLKTGGRYLEPFTGGANLLYRLTNVRRAICGDAHPGLIALYNAVLDGWVPPSEVSEECYRFLRENKDNGPLCTFVAFASSFGGVEWTAYSRQAGRNPTAEGARSVLRKILGRNSDKVHYVNASYLQHDMVRPYGYVIYCDPPYRGVSLYSTPDFDNDMFEEWCEIMVSLGHSVFVSEYTAPKHWGVIYGQPTKSTGNKEAKAPGQVDKLYRVRAKQ